MKLSKPIIPKEHGAWAVFLVPLLIGVGHGGGFRWPAVLFLISSLGIFLSYVPAQTLLRTAARTSQDEEKARAARHWIFVYLLISVASILPVLVALRRWLLLPIGFIGLGSFLMNFVLTRIQPKTIASDLTAVVGLTLSAPAAYYVTSGNLDGAAMVLWVLNILFFGSCVVYVHTRLRALAARKSEWSWRDRMTYGGVNLLYHAIMLGILALLALNQLTPALQLLAYTPITVNAVWGTLTLVSAVDFRKLGFTLLTHSIVFLVLSLFLF